MRTIIDLPDDQLKALSDVCEREGISRAEAVRRAVAEFTSTRTRPVSETAFGVWRRRSVAGLAYERRLRSEW